MDEIPASEFDSRTFDAKEVVQRYRKRVPLPQLQKSLRAHSAATRQELVELINEKYADFVSLSSRMQGVERALRPLRPPLEESSELTKNLHTKLGLILEQAKATKQELTAARARKDALAAYIENSKILERAKESAEQRWANPQEPDGFSREYIAQENTARDLRRIRLNLGGRPHQQPAAAGAGASTSRPAPPPPPTGAAAVLSASGRPEASPVAGPEHVESGAEESSPECQALLNEASEFEEVFAGRLRERLLCLVRSAKQCWELPLPPQGSEQEAAAAGPEPGPPPRSDLLAIAHLSRALVTIGRPGVVEGIFAEVFVKGALNDAAAKCSAAAEETRRHALGGTGCGDAGLSGSLGIGAGAVDLGPFFDAVRSSLLVQGAPLLWLARCFRSSPGASDGDGGEANRGVDDDAESALLAVPSLRLVSNSIATPTLQHVQQVWPNVFMPAFPDVFAVNHSHAMRFVTAVESFMPSSEMLAFSQCFVLTDFRRRWKTQVYFSLRQKEAVQRLEALAAKPGGLGQAAAPSSSVAAPTKSKRPLSLEASAELLRILELMWSDRWYLDCLYPKMVQLSLELFSRYGKLASSLAEVAETPAIGWDAGASPPSWNDTSPPVRFARIAADVLEFGASLEPDVESGGLARMIIGRLPASSAASSSSASSPAAVGSEPAKRSPKDLVRMLLAEASAGLRPASGALEKALVEHVAAAAAPQFGAIRGIPALYRMLNKPVPTKPSPYVEAALRPILALREATHALAPPDAVVRWMRLAADAAATEFGVQASQLLQSTQQQEASLRRLGGRGGGATGDAQVSDLDKIHIQLCLDAEAFATAAESLGSGVAAEGRSGTGLSQLAAAVAPARPALDAQRERNAGAGGAASA